MANDAESRRSVRQPAGTRPGRASQARALFEAAEDFADQAQVENDAERYRAPELTRSVAARARRARPQPTAPEVEP